MTAKLVEIDGDKYWIGLTWTVTSASESISKQIDSIRKDLGGKGLWCVIENTENSLLGYASKPSGKVKAAKSLASSVLYAKDEAWMGTFQIDEGLYWYVAIREHSILGKGDFIGSKEDVEKIQNEYASLGDWQFEEGDVSRIEELLKESVSRGVKKATVNVFANRLAINRWLIVSVLAVALGTLYYHHRTVVKNEKIMEALREKALWAMRHKKVPLPPWDRREPFGVVLDRCLSEYQKLPIAQNGWEPHTFICSESGADIGWRALSTGMVPFSPEGIISENGKADLQHISFPPYKLPVKATEEKAGEGKSLSRVLYEMSGSVGGTLSAPAISKIPAWIAKGKSREDLKYQKVEYSLQISDLSDLRLFRDIQTLRLERIEGSDGPGFVSWKVQIMAWVK